MFCQLAHGEALLLPHFGQETVHHIHADDIASAFLACMAHPERSAGWAYHIVSPQATSLRGLAQGVCRLLFQRNAVLSFVPWDEFAASLAPEDAEAVLTHITHSPSCSTAKITQQLGFVPAHGSIEMVAEAAQWLIDHDGLDFGNS
jgi:nucleoside-diphosphate-sugar epimerase